MSTEIEIKDDDEDTNHDKIAPPDPKKDGIDRTRHYTRVIRSRDPNGNSVTTTVTWKGSCPKPGHNYRKRCRAQYRRRLRKNLKNKQITRKMARDARETMEFEHIFNQDSSDTSYGYSSTDTDTVLSSDNETIDDEKPKKKKSKTLHKQMSRRRKSK